MVYVIWCDSVVQLVQYRTSHSLQNQSKLVFILNVGVGLSCGVYCGLMFQFMRDACTLHVAYELEQVK